MPMMFFHFLKIIFNISTSKRSKKYKPHSILVKKNFKFNTTRLQTQCQTVSKSYSQLPKSLAGNLSFVSFYLTEYLKLKLTVMLRISLPKLHRYWFTGCLRHLKHDAKGAERK